MTKRTSGDEAGEKAHALARNDAYQRALGSLRHKAPPGDVAALLVRLQQERRPTTWRERAGILLERLWPTWRLPVMGTATASGAALATFVMMFVLQTGVDAPLVSAIEFDGASAMVMHTHSDREHTTLIWLSDADAADDGAADTVHEVDAGKEIVEDSGEEEDI